MARLAATLLALAASIPACRDRPAQPDVADVAAAPEGFVPAPSKPVEFDSPGLRLEAPGNVPGSADGGVVTFAARGFPDVRIAVEETESASGGGFEGRCDLGECRFVRIEPCRRISCEASGVGDHQPAVTSICSSVRSTHVPSSRPAVRFLSESTTSENCDERQKQIASILDEPIRGLLPRVATCWERQVGEHPEWSAGAVNVRLARQVLKQGGASYGIEVVVSGLEGDTQALRDCIDAGVAPFRRHMPDIVDADCSFGFDHRFLLDRETDCSVAPSAPGSDAGLSDA